MLITLKVTSHMGWIGYVKIHKDDVRRFSRTVINMGGLCERCTEDEYETHNNQEMKK